MPDLSGAALLVAWEDWECPACGLTQRVAPPLPPNAARMHTCPKMQDLTAPMVRAGSDCKVEAVLRADYEGPDAGALRLGADGRPYMNVTTTYADGRNDCAVFAPVARISLSG